MPCSAAKKVEKRKKNFFFLKEGNKINFDNYNFFLNFLKTGVFKGTNKCFGGNR